MSRVIGRFYEVFYDHDMIFDEINCRYVSYDDYKEFEELLLEETQEQKDIKAGIGELPYPEYNMAIVRDILKEKGKKL